MRSSVLIFFDVATAHSYPEDVSEEEGSDKDFENMRGIILTAQ